MNKHIPRDLGRQRKIDMARDVLIGYDMLWVMGKKCKRNVKTAVKMLMMMMMMMMMMNDVKNNDWRVMPFSRAKVPVIDTPHSTTRRSKRKRERENNSDRDPGAYFQGNTYSSSLREGMLRQLIHNITIPAPRSTPRSDIDTSIDQLLQHDTITEC